MNPAIIQLLSALLTAGINTYQQMSNNANANDINALKALVPIASNVYTALDKIGTVLTQAQAEGWTVDDARWQPVFDEADAALKAAEAQL